jgi:uncharacterized protein (TIGR03437 family)
MEQKMFDSRAIIFCAGFLSLWSLSGSSAAAAPVITSAVNAANYQPGVASATWIAISGSDLSRSTRQWADGDFTGDNLPTKLDDVQVTINGKPAYVAFISPGQVNVLCPDDVVIGQVPVQLTNSQGASNTIMLTKQAVAPALFAYAQLRGRYAVIQAGGTYELVGPPGLFGQQVGTFTAAPGENLVLYTTGLGPVSPPQPTGQLVSTPAPTVNPVKVLIGNQPAIVQFAGIIGSGLYQVNVVVPALPSGDAPILVSVNGVQSSAGVFVPVQAFPGTVGGQTTPTLTGCLKGQVDYVSYSVGRLYFDLPDEVSIGGAKICATCSVKPPLFPEFATRMETSIGRKQAIQACYDSSGTIFQIGLMHP